MKNSTLDLLDDLLLELKPALIHQNPSWRDAERAVQTLHEDFKTAHTGDRRLICQVNDLLDALSASAEYESECFFHLGLQMGLELGSLDLLGE